MKSIGKLFVLSGALMGTPGCESEKNTFSLAEFSLKSIASVGTGQPLLEVTVTHSFVQDLKIDAYDLGLKAQFPNLIGFVRDGERAQQLGDVQYLGIQDRLNLRGSSYLRWPPHEALVIRVELARWYRGNRVGCYHIEYHLPATSWDEDVHVTPAPQYVESSDGTPMTICWQDNHWVYWVSE